jgi:uncharacterized protein (DUF58 family)
MQDRQRQDRLIDETVRVLQTRIFGQRTNRRRIADETLIQRRPLYVITAVLILGALILRQPLLVVAGLLVGVVAIVPEVWYRFGLRGLVIRRAPVTSQAMFGDEVDITLTVENRQVLALPWLEINDEFPEALPLVGMRARDSFNPERLTITSALGMWANQRVRRRFRVRCQARGAFRFGPMLLRMTDPFGMLTREERLAEKAVLLVYPLVAPLERFGLPAQSPFGEHKAPRHLLDDPLRIAGVRPYQHGDEPRRIHWKATARSGELQSKIYEPATQHTVAIFLDVRTYQRSLYGYDPQLVELAITTAASVANWALEQGFATGVYANSALAAPEIDDPLPGEPAKAAAGEESQLAAHPEQSYAAAIGTPASGGRPPDAPTRSGGGASSGASGVDGYLRRLRNELAGTLRLRVPPAANPAQLTRVMDGLARLLPYGGLPMEQMLAGEEGRLPIGTTVVYVGAEPAVDVPVMVALRRMKTLGYAVTLLLTGTPTSQGRPIAGIDASPAMNLAGLNAYRIGGRELWAELVADVLQQPPAGETHEHSSPPSVSAESQHDERVAYARSRRALVVK